MSNTTKAGAPDAAIPTMQNDAPDSKPPGEEQYIIVLKHPIKGTFHAVLDPKRGEGALATFASFDAATSEWGKLGLKNQGLRNCEYSVLPIL